MSCAKTLTGGPWCWECRYDLSGLPERGCCPECGSRYDAALYHPVTLREKIADSPAALRHALTDETSWLMQKVVFHARTAAVIMLVLGSSAITVTFAVLAYQAFVKHR